MEIPAVPGSVHLEKDIVGSHLANYDSILVLSHFKGHAMGGFGGRSKIFPSALRPRTERCIFIPEERRTSALRLETRTRFWSPWPRQRAR